MIFPYLKRIYLPYIHCNMAYFCIRDFTCWNIQRFQRRTGQKFSWRAFLQLVLFKQLSVLIQGTEGKKASVTELIISEQNSTPATGSLYQKQDSEVGRPLTCAQDHPDPWLQRICATRYAPILLEYNTARPHDYTIAVFMLFLCTFWKTKVFISS